MPVTEWALVYVPGAAVSSVTTTGGDGPVLPPTIPTAGTAEALGAIHPSATAVAIVGHHLISAPMFLLGGPPHKVRA
jgi:hypothetical protein